MMITIKLSSHSAGMIDPHSHLSLANPRIRAQHTADILIHVTFTYYIYTRFSIAILYCILEKMKAI